MKYLHRLRDEVIHNSNLRSLANGSAKSAKSPLNLPFDTFDTSGEEDIQISNVDNSSAGKIYTPPLSELPKVSKASILEACEGVIDPEVFRANLTPEDLADIEAGRVSVAYLRCAAESMRRRK